MVKFEVQGLSQLAANLQALPTRVSKTIQRNALKMAAEPIRQAIADKAPYRPGKPDLRDEIVVSNARGIDAQETAVAVGPSKARFYGSFAEFGTAFETARPFARPAFDENWQRALDELRVSLWAALSARGLSVPFPEISTDLFEDVPVQAPGGGGLL